MVFSGARGKGLVSSMGMARCSITAYLGRALGVQLAAPWPPGSCGAQDLGCAFTAGEACSGRQCPEHPLVVSERHTDLYQEPRLEMGFRFYVAFYENFHSMYKFKNFPDIKVWLKSKAF